MCYEAKKAMDESLAKTSRSSKPDFSQVSLIISIFQYIWFFFFIIIISNRQMRLNLSASAATIQMI